MKHFKILAGKHIENHQTYNTGDIVKSEKDLDKIFGVEKFERITSIKKADSVSTESKKVSEEVSSEIPDKSTEKSDVKTKTKTEANSEKSKKKASSRRRRS